MGPVELLLGLLTGAVGVAVLVVLALVLRRRDAPAVEPRAPLPWLALLLALLGLLVSPLLGFGLGGVVLEGLVSPCVDGLGAATVGELHEPVLARVYAGGLVALWLGLPAALALGWLLGSRSRSVGGAVALAVLCLGGFTLGVLLGRLWVVPAVTQGLGELLPGASVQLLELVRTVVSALAVLGLAGACAPVAWLLSSRSQSALLWTAVASAAMPGCVLVVAAIATPPDLISQLLVALLLGTSWLLGLGAGALSSLVRR